MADMIKCSVCGENNPADNEFCKNCLSRLQPLTGPLKGENAPLKPGQIPTKKTTSELEPILPQWLREARRQSRQVDEDGSSLAAQEPPTVPVSSGPDLLAGLASQSDDDEDVPDWLVNITGNAPAKKKKVEQEDSNIKRVEIGGPDDFSETPAKDKGSAPSAPSWMSPEEQGREKDELASWLAGMGQASASFADEKAAPVQPAESMSDASSSNADKSDWLHNLQSGPSTFDEIPLDQTPISGDETRDWLKNLDAGAVSIEQSPAQPITAPRAPATDNESPDWFKNLDAGAVSFEQTPAQPAPAPPASPAHSDTPDWLKNLDTNAALFEQKSVEQPAPASDEPVLPDWMKTLGETPASSAPAVEPPPSNGMMPDWLKAAAPSGDTPQAARPVEPANEDNSQAVDMPDWLSSLKPVEPPAQQHESAPPAFAQQKPDEAPSVAPAFADDSLSSGDVDAIFGSMQMPDWLSSVAPQPPAAENLPPAAQPAGSIAPADLPSWVQAMRPVEATFPDASQPESADTNVETNGPLAGLQGILPSIPGGMKPSSRPKAHSIKLNASEEQQAHSALLEQILTEETSPVPMRSPSTVLSQRVLRWVITAFVFLSVGGIFFARTQIFALPGRVPLPNDETEAAISKVDAIPVGAPVLVVFDYEPSLAGELEATAAPLFNRLLLQNRPVLAIVSTSPTGPALAERFMSTTLKGLNYQRDLQYVDLGYLAGGLAGVYDFAQNPAAVMPFGADGKLAWQSAILNGKTHLSDFAAIIVLTDSTETGRVWIEQAAPFRGNASFLVMSSAQAGPMLMPYMQSGQINGLVAGLNSAAKIEQANGQPGLARRYWDAYSLGLLLAVAFLLLGGLWNFILGLQARRAQEAIK